MEHMKSHSGDKVYPCATCGLLFTDRGRRDEHMEQHRQVRATLCGSDTDLFKEIYGLRMHGSTIF